MDTYIFVQILKKVNLIGCDKYALIWVDSHFVISDKKLPMKIFVISAILLALASAQDFDEDTVGAIFDGKWKVRQLILCRNWTESVQFRQRISSTDLLHQIM